MPLYVRLFWGLIGGLAVVSIKVIGPDQLVVKDMWFKGDNAEILFYALISALTILVAGFAALFSEEKTPLKILVFAASFPALVSTYISAPKGKPDVGTAELAGRQQAFRGIGLGLVSIAHADDFGNEYVCDEGSFTERFGAAATNYLLNQPANDSYAVVVASETSFAAAKQKADDLAARTSKYAIGVGCRRPGNPAFPVVVSGTTDDLATALAIKADTIAEGLGPSDTYVSNYPARQIVYKAPAR